MTPVAVKDATIYVEPVRTETIALALIGSSPLILNRMSEKAKRELLYPKGRKTTADKQASLKHLPLDEYRASMYVLPEGGDALLGVMASAVKGAMMTAALDLPGTRKAQIGRLVHVRGDYAPVYGVPKLFMSVTRSAGMNQTPDIRTRAIVPRWAALVEITYVMPMLTPTAIANLLTAGGVTAGIGDWRPEKGKGAYGQFVVSDANDPTFIAIREGGGREAQQAAVDAPETYDEDSRQLLAWYTTEVLRRGK